MSDDLARRAFDMVFADYQISEADLAWRVFLAGWQCREMIANDSDLIRLRKEHKGHLDA